MRDDDLGDLASDLIDYVDYERDIGGLTLPEVRGIIKATASLYDDSHSDGYCECDACETLHGVTMAWDNRSSREWVEAKAVSVDLSRC